MTKSELLAVLAEKTGVDRGGIERVLSSFNKVIVDRLIEDKEVQVLGLGKIKIVNRVERQGRNLRTGEAMVIPAKDVPKFVFSKNIKELVSENKK